MYVFNGQLHLCLTMVKLRKIRSRIEKICAFNKHPQQGPLTQSFGTNFYLNPVLLMDFIDLPRSKTRS